MPELITPIAGVDLATTLAGTGSSSDQGNDFKLGTSVHTVDGGEYVYCHASAAISQYDAVAIDENFEVTPLEDTQANDGWTIGFAQVAFADNDFGWVALRGSNINCKIITGAAADVALYTSASTSLAGQLQQLTSVGTLILGVIPVAASNTSVSVTPEIIATNPTAYLVT